jgi:hypothetical protein
LLPDASREPWNTVKRFASNDALLRGEAGRELYTGLFEALAQIIAIVDRMDG